MVFNEKTGAITLHPHEWEKTNKDTDGGVYGITTICAGTIHFYNRSSLRTIYYVQVGERRHKYGKYTNKLTCRKIWFAATSNYRMPWVSYHLGV